MEVKKMTITCPVNDGESVHIRSNSFMQNPEFRLKSRDRQDRSVKHKNYALTTDKGNLLGWRYSLNLCNNQNMKYKINKFDCGSVQYYG